jgi:GNAT superfamily N-acetyltransferase
VPEEDPSGSERARTYIRRAVAADAAAVSDVYLASRRAFLPYAPLAHTDDEVRSWIGQHLIPAGGVRVALSEDAIVGMLACSDDGAARWIDQLYVLPQAVRQGIGSALLHHALRELAPPIRLYTFRANHAARRFYERHGFRPIAFGDGSDNEERCPDVLYEWQARCEMKALTLTQPYATLVALGAKRIETRSWATPYRGPLAIHAGHNLAPVGGLCGLQRLCAQEPFRSTLFAGGYADARQLPRGAIVAVAELVACCAITNDGLVDPAGASLRPLPDEAERSFGDYRSGRYAWLLANVCLLDLPAPARGRLGLWTWQGTS